MATEIPGLIISLKSSGDMSAHQYKAVRASSANEADGCTVVATRGGLLTGVYLDNSTAATFGRVQVGGVAKLQAGDSSGGAVITQGLPVVCSSAGAAVASTAAGQYRIGVALDTLAAGTTGIIRVAQLFGITT